MNTRTFVVGRRQAGRTLLESLQSHLQLTKADALLSLKLGGVRVGGSPCNDPLRRVRSGQRIQAKIPDPKPARKPKPVKREAPPLPPLAHEIAIRHFDAHLLVVEKPPGLTTVRHADEAAEFGKRAQKFLPPTLVDLLPAVLKEQRKSVKGRIRAVHRLDKETSGLIVLALTAEAESHLGKQFRAHTIERVYLALVRSQAQDGRIESKLVADRGDGRRGSSTGGGQNAITNVWVLERFGDFALVECRLETGRTHQVRIHLGEAGTPLCGERVYDRALHGLPMPDTSGARRPLLHAASLAFDHPVTGKRLEFEAEEPEDMKRVLRRLRPGAADSSRIK